MSPKFTMRKVFLYNETNYTWTNKILDGIFCRYTKITFNGYDQNIQIYFASGIHIHDMHDVHKILKTCIYVVGHHLCIFENGCNVMKNKIFDITYEELPVIPMALSMI